MQEKILTMSNQTIVVHIKIYRLRVSYFSHGHKDKLHVNMDFLIIGTFKNRLHIVQFYCIMHD